LARNELRLTAASAGPVRRLAVLLGLPVVMGAGPAQVIDGDTLDLAGERIRLWGIDALEGDQVCQRNGQPWQCGDIAARALETLVHDREITCTETDRDRYGRAVARCTVAGEDVGAAMVRSGWALDYERYSGGAYAAEQLEAEQAQRGLWSGSFVSPWEWRRAGR
jgi:endonuclease YncB( thermonuclease family)